ncbi:MAG: TRAP transporter substrate-binding protein DctP [Deltaproteobacteria bacterium]|nr:TRAP transporter substrate-binding protein DctP [Deltaproteobacteria bacterium]
MSDLKGLKLRVDGSLPSKLFKKLGATPVFLPVPGIYEAAEKGVIDGSVMMWAMVATFKTYEVFRYWTDVSLYPAAIALAMNLDKWNSLPPDVQKGIMSVSGANGSAFAGRTAWSPELEKEVYARAEKIGKKFEKVNLDAGELEKWKQKAGKPIWDEWVKRMEKKGLPGREVLDKALKLTAKYR